MKYERLNCMFHVKTELYFHADIVRGDGAAQHLFFEQMKQIENDHFISTSKVKYQLKSKE